MVKIETPTLAALTKAPTVSLEFSQYIKLMNEVYKIFLFEKPKQYKPKPVFHHSSSHISPPEKNTSNQCFVYKYIAVCNRMVGGNSVEGSLGTFLWDSLGDPAAITLQFSCQGV